MPVETMYLGTKDILSCKRTHEKVFSGEMLDLVGQPRWYWICSECLETGSDSYDVNFTPHTAAAKYWKLMRSLNPSCWVPQAFRAGHL